MNLSKTSLQMKSIVRLLYRWNKQFSKSICIQGIKIEFKAQILIKLHKRKLKKKMRVIKLQNKFRILFQMNQHNKKKKLTRRLSLHLKVWDKSKWLR